MNRDLSKSKLLAWRQCPKRLWLELYRPDLREDTPATEANFETGNEVGDVARRVFDPEGKGLLIDVMTEGGQEALQRSAEALNGKPKRPVFEAGFTAHGVRAFADVMVPVPKTRRRAWHMIEVKSAASVKDYHRDDVAIQAFIAREAGVPLERVFLARIDSKWTYPGGGKYEGLFAIEDLTDEASARKDEVRDWIGDAKKIAARKRAPRIETGAHCSSPYSCGFLDYCRKKEKEAEYPIAWLPAGGKLEAEGYADLRDVPNDRLNERQRMVKNQTLKGTAFFNAAAAAKELAPHKAPLHFLDFETVQFAVPVWKGTRPYQQIPFQFSVHSMSRSGKTTHREFLDLSGKDPSKPFAEALLAACGKKGAIFTYNAAFERGRISYLASRFPRLKEPLLAINERLVDLLPIARDNYYHPNQQGSWSIKRVLPAIAPDLGYEALDGVQDGNMAMTAYREAIHEETVPGRKAEIEKQLLAYCKLDTLALVRLWQFFGGRL
ncbi:DUF2779 domain-containing protein [Tepidicaulis sp. LMO-SS28]|uniref:DUF2779 domain-containing protein n=1 Tax=Tepidicaulis sp. LMO-SS28 TaxID=3447455 RepID=UPI003EE01147